MKQANAASPNGPAAVVGAAVCETYAPDAIRQALQGVLAPLGGIGAFVHPGQTVLLNPNLLSPRPPEDAVTTHPELVAAVVTACLEAGATHVWVGDSPAGNHNEEHLWETTGMTAAVQAAGGEMKSFVGPVKPIACGDRKVPAPEWLDEVDLLISLPKLKTHLLTLLTCALKNAYGMIPGESKAMFHGDYPSPRSIARFIVQVFATFRPTLSIVDAVQAMEGNGPSTGQPIDVGLLLAARDAVALDACCARLLGLDPGDIPIITYAEEAGLGTADPRQISLQGNIGNRLEQINMALPLGRHLQRLPEGAFRVLTRMLTHRPEIDPKRCVRCGRCAEICSQCAISQDSKGRYRVDRSACILCMCCLESCPHDAVSVHSPLVKLVHLRNAIRRVIRHALRGD